MKQYTPRAGSTAARAIEHLTQHGTTEPRALADAIGTEFLNLSAALNHALKWGMVIRDKDGNYALPNASQEEGEGEETAAEDFVVGLFSDGELCFMNAGKTGDVELILTQEQTNIVFNYMLSFNRDQQTTTREPWSLKHD